MNPATFKIIRYANAAMRSVLDGTTPAWERYCKRHGYDHYLYTNECENPYLEKLKLIQCHLACGNERVVWVDADCAMTNPHIPLKQLLPLNEWPLVFAEDSNGLCSGIIVATQEALPIIKLVRQLGEPSPSTHTLFGGIDAHEQNTFKLLIKHFPSISAHCCTVPKLQSYPSAWKPGDFILHAAQRSNEERLRIINDVTTLIL